MQVLSSPGVMSPFRSTYLEPWVEATNGIARPRKVGLVVASTAQYLTWSCSLSFHSSKRHGVAPGTEASHMKRPTNDLLAMMMDFMGHDHDPMMMPFDGDSAWGSESEIYGYDSGYDDYAAAAFGYPDPWDDGSDYGSDPDDLGW